MPRRRKAKRFASEAEEAAWWEAREGRLADEFEKTAAGDRAHPAMVVITGDSMITKVRLRAKDVALVRTRAKERNLRCHDYLKLLIHEALCAVEEKKNPDEHSEM